MKDIFIFVLSMLFSLNGFAGNLELAKENYKWIQEPKFEFQEVGTIDVHPFSVNKLGKSHADFNHILYVKNNDKYGLVDYSGKILQEPDTEEKPYLCNCQNEVIAVLGEGMYNKNGGFIDTHRGHGFLSDLAYDRTTNQFGNMEQDSFTPRTSDSLSDLYSFQEVVCSPKRVNNLGGLDVLEWTGKYGLVYMGKIVASAKYDEIYESSEGLVAVRYGEKWGFVDTNGTELIVPEYDWVGSFEKGLAPVSKDGKFGYIDKANQQVTGLVFDGALPINAENGYSWVKFNGKWGVVQVQKANFE